MRASWIGILAAVLHIGTWALPCRADWPANRHDAARSAKGDGVSRIAQPSVAWRYYLGGGVTSSQLMARDLNGDGNDDFLFVSGDRLFAKSANDVLLWRTVPLNARHIQGIADFDGDGVSEALISSDRRIHIVRLSDGAVTWTIPDKHIGNPGAVRIADFNADGVADIYVADLACGSPESLGDAAEAWSFVSAPRQLFALERGRRDYICGENDALVDFDGDKALEVVTQGTEYFYVYSGADGHLISQSESLGSIPYGLALTRVANIDADPAPEIIAYVDTNYAPPLTTRRVFMLDWDAAARRLVRRWERSVENIATDKHAFGVGGLGDIGADGSLEVVTSFRRGPADTWTTLVLDAATGVERASVPSGPFQGLAELSAAAGPEVVTGDQVQGTRVYRWAAGGLTLSFEAARFEPIIARSQYATFPSGAVNGLIALDLDRNGAQELLGVSYGPDGVVPEALLALGGADGKLNETARVALGPGAAVPVVIRIGDKAGSPQLAVARSDGFLWVVNEALEPINLDPGDVPSFGVRLGGYYSGQQGMGRVPVAGDLDGDGADEIVVSDSRNVILGLNAARATLMRPPVTRWEIFGGRLPLLVDVDQDRQYELAYWTTTPRASALKLVHGVDATGIWQRSIGDFDLAPSNDLMAGDLNGDNELDLVYSMFSSAAGSLRVNVASGKNGATLWLADYEAVVAGYGVGDGSLLDREGDGRLDVLVAPRAQLQWLSGATGAVGPSASVGYADYGLLVPSGGSQGPTLVTSGSPFSVHSLSMELAPRWEVASLEQGRSNGVVVRCSSERTLLVAGRFSSARVSAWNVVDGKLDGEVFLANGAASAQSGLNSQGMRVGSVILSMDLLGVGRPSVLVPSTDGFLYAIDPCTMKLDWALNLDAPVGEAILADTDGDREDEIVVTAGDGFLYGIDRPSLAEPTYVYENDGTEPAKNEDADVNLWPRQDTLSANWAAVEGATSYRYAVLDDSGKAIPGSEPIDVGNTTSVTASGLNLKIGTRYRFAVRAVGPAGTSPEALSDGVTVVEDPCSACGDGTHCVDRVCVAEADDGGIGKLCDPASTESPSPLCAACGRGTCCEGNMCVAVDRPRKGGGCCSVAGTGSNDLGGYLALLLVGLLAARRGRVRRDSQQRP